MSSGSIIDKLVGLTSSLSSGARTTHSSSISRDRYLSSISRNIWEFLYLKYWKLASQGQRIRMLLGVSITFLSVYIISPSITYHFKSQAEKDKMFSSKRQDKYTTGLINTRNDCFANSSIQAFAALPGLDLYLNDILKQYQEFTALSLKSTEEQPLPNLVLHEALASIIQQLQEPITSAKYVSVWPFLHVIEKIFNSKISTNQNDAHELIQLILETLENETTKFKKYIKKNGISLNVPDLPFNGLLADQLTCLSCLNSSKPSFHPFSVLSLPVPESPTASLSDMIKNSEVETINGYNCLRCKIKSILKVEEGKLINGVKLTEADSQIISKLKIMEPNLTINDDLDKNLEEFIKDYTYDGFKTSNLQSTIVKKTLVVKAPALLTVHLSRSVFTANHITRNSCKVDFEDIVDIDIDDNLALAYEEKLKSAKKTKKLKDNHSILSDPQSSLNNGGANGNFENEIDDDEVGIDGYDDDRNEPAQLARIHSKILASHDEDADSPQHEEDPTIDSSEIDFHSTSDKVHSNSTDVTSLEVDAVEEEEEGDDSDDGSIHSQFSEDLNVSRENAKYKLRAIIRHQGTHNAGHYECFRHKPLLVKDTRTDKIVNLSPVINYGNEENNEASTTQSKDSSVPNTIPVHSQKKPSKFRGSSSSSPTNIESQSRGSQASNDDNNNDESGGFSKFKNKLGSFVSRRSSVSQGSTSRRASIAIPPPSNNVLTSVTENREVADLTTEFQHFEMNADTKTSKDKKYKKISSVAKYPYWRISDTLITEVRRADVLREKAGVYMIYYERVKPHT